MSGQEFVLIIIGMSMFAGIASFALKRSTSRNVMTLSFGPSR